MDSDSSPTTFLSRLYQRLNWIRAILAAAFAAVVVGVIVYVFIPLQYSASTSFLFSDRPNIAATLAQFGEASSAAGSLVGIASRGSQLQRFDMILKSTHVRRKLVDAHNIEGVFQLTEDEALRFLSDLTAIRHRGTVISEVGMEVVVTCRGPSRLGQWLGWNRPLSTREASQLCADLANGYAEALDEYITDTNRGAAQETKQFVDRRLGEVNAELSDIEDQIEELQMTYSLLDPRQKADTLLDGTQAIAKAHALSRARVEQLMYSLEVARDKLGDMAARRIAAEVEARNPVITNLEENLAERRAKLASLKGSGLTDAHPDVAELQSAIASSEQTLAGVTENVRQQVSIEVNPTHDNLLEQTVNLEVTLAGAEAELASYKRQLDTADAELSGLPPVAREYVDLVRRQQVFTELLTALAKRKELAALEEKALGSGAFEVLDQAVPPVRKSGPPTVKVAVLTGVLLFVLMALLIARRDGLISLSEPLE